MTGPTTKKIFVQEDHFKKLSGKEQRQFTDFILETGCDYFPHARETRTVIQRIPLADGTIDEQRNEYVNDWWEMRLPDEMDMTLMQIKFPDCVIFRKMDDYENQTPGEFDDFDNMTSLDPGAPPRVFVKTEFNFRNERPLADMLKTYVTNADLYDLAEKEEESYMMNKLKK